MSDEEKKAIKDCDFIFINLEEMLSKEGANDYRKSYKILKNIIKKQQKEIEELKEKNKELYEIKYIASRFINRSMKQFSIGEFKYKVNNFIECEDKIKAKIEECEKELKEYEKMEDYVMKYDSVFQIETEINILQSLLEKE